MIDDETGTAEPAAAMHPSPRFRSPQRRTAVARVAALAACAALASSAAAQRALDEIVVTATRRAVAASEVSQPVTVIAEGIAPSDKLVTDALANGVGVYLQQTTPGQGAAIVRGLRGSSLLHLVDGMRLNNALFRSAPTQYLALVPATAVERIEVLRGTPASLYGTDAVGGAIQLVTRQPRFESDALAVTGSAALALDTAELTRSVRGTIDVGTRRLAGTLSGEHLTAGDRRIGGGERIGPSGYDARAARFALAGAPAEAWRWLVDLHYAEQPSTPRVDELVPGFGQAEPASAEFRFEPDRRTFVHGRLERDAGWLELDWRLDAAWQRIDDDRVTRDLGDSERRRERNASDLYGLTLSAGRRTDRGSWLVGAERYDDRVSSSRSATDIVDGSTRVLAPRFPDGARLRQSSLYAHASHDIGQRHVLSAGLRISRAAVDLPGTAASLDTTDYGADLGWIFRVTDNWRLVANAGRGFRAPNVFDLGTLGERPGNRFNVPNASLDSEQVRQADLGLRYEGERARLEITAWALRYEDRIISVLTGGVTAAGRDVVQSENAARSTIRGIEAGGRWSLTPALSGHAVVNVTRGAQREAGGETEPADRIPPLSGRVGLVYEGSGADAEAWLRYAGAQERLSERDSRDPRIDPAGTAGWVALDARVTWHDVSGWQITAGVDNALDVRYRVHGSGLDAPGRNLHVALQRRF